MGWFRSVLLARRCFEEGREGGRRRERGAHQAEDFCFQVFGWGVGQLLAVATGWGALPDGARRYYTEQPDELTSGQRRRSCVSLLGWKRHFEVPSGLRGTKHYRPTLHLTQDQCGASWQGWNCQILGVRCRGTLQWD